MRTVSSTNFQEGNIYEVIYDKEKYEIRQVEINGRKGDLYFALDETETNNLVWMDEAKGIVFSINGYLEGEDIEHIAEELLLCKTPKEKITQKDGKIVSDFSIFLRYIGTKKN